MSDEAEFPGDDNKLPTAGDKAADTAKRLANGGWGLAKKFGSFVKQKAEEKIDDTKQRMAEPKLTASEQTTIQRYRAIQKLLPRDHLAGHPPLPQEGMLNRREIREFLASPKVPDFIAAGEQAAADAEAARIEAENQAAAERARQFEVDVADIDKFYANTLNDITITVAELQTVLPAGAVSQAGDLAFEGSRSTLNKNWLGGQSQSTSEDIGKLLYKGLRKGSATDAIQGSRFQRALVSMSEQERAALRLADMLLAIGAVAPEDILKARAPIVWNKGECLVTIEGNYGGNLRKREAALQALKSLISSYFGEPATGTETIKAHLARVMEPNGAHPTIQRVLARYIVSGGRWMMPEEAAAFTPKGASPSALRLGKFSDSDKEFLFDMNESLITVAAPGTGKSQAHVLRNLLYIDAPAVVLDVKGEMRDHSAAWRAQNVGPVHIFAPTTPATSLHYNPLDFISDDTEHAWDEARRLADLLFVPAAQKGGDSYFDDRARDMITTAVLDVAIAEKGDKRNMTSVLDRLYLSEDDALSAWFEHLEGLGVSQLRRQASALKGMPPKQREGIFDSARRQLEIWQSPAIERLTTSSTFSAETLRLNNATCTCASHWTTSRNTLRCFASSSARPSTSSAGRPRRPTAAR
ncbi:type IV secretory system conjugative DNA transfer family protein [Mesorhizobium sp. M0478]